MHQWALRYLQYAISFIIQMGYTDTSQDAEVQLDFIQIEVLHHLQSHKHSIRRSSHLTETMHALVDEVYKIFFIAPHSLQIKFPTAGYVERGQREQLELD